MLKAELCVSTLKGIEVAKKFQLDRIELCQDLENGGLTPSLGLMHTALENHLETHVLIRPRIGGFVYTETEKKLILREIEHCTDLGVQGVVVGALTSENRIDSLFVRQMKECAKNMEITFHRAFDFSNDWKEDLTLLINLEFDRILFSGLAHDVGSGMKNFQMVRDFCQHRIQLMAGGGVHQENIHQLVALNCLDAVHFSGTQRLEPDFKTAFDASYLEVDEEKVSTLVSAIKH